MNKVFLGGTCNNSTWREELMPMLNVAYFNPVVDDWTPECQENEEIEKAQRCNIHLYVITSAMTGAFSIAEAVESSMTQGKLTVFHVIPDGFTEGQVKSLNAVAAMIKKHGGSVCIDNDMSESINTLNALNI